VAYDGHAALARLRAASFEVGLFDIGLPGISGYQLAHEARQIPANKGLYMVAVTGWGQDADRERARVSGFDAHLTKPADPDALRALIARCGEPVS
jgi:CheY-like chemotaxis protein